MKQVRSLILIMACNSAVVAMDQSQYTINKVQRHSDILSLQQYPEISFQGVLDVTNSITKTCFNHVIKPTGNGVVTIAQWAAPYAFVYFAACVIDPMPYSLK